MDKMQPFVQFILLLGVMLWAVACGILQPEPTPTDPGVAVELREPATAPEASVPDTYALGPPVGAQNQESIG